MIPPIAIENEIATAAWLFWEWIIYAGPGAACFLYIMWVKKL
jgi:hypothetical protein